MASNLASLNSPSIRRLINSLGLDESKKLLTDALPIITNRKNDLLTALQQKDFETANQLAHKTMGSIRLYGSSELEMLLQEVISLKSIKACRPNLFNELELEFDHAIHEIEQCINIDIDAG